MTGLTRKTHKHVFIKPPLSFLCRRLVTLFRTSEGESVVQPTPPRLELFPSPPMYATVSTTSAPPTSPLSPCQRLLSNARSRSASKPDHPPASPHPQTPIPFAPRPVFQKPLSPVPRAPALSLPPCATSPTPQEPQAS